MAKNKRIKKKKKHSNNAAAIFSAAVVVIMFAFILLFRTSIFEIHSIHVIGNSLYKDEEIIEKSGIKISDKIYNINKEKTKQKILNDNYIEKVKIVFKFPDIIYLDIEERNEEIILISNDKYLITDKNGFVLREDIYFSTELIPIEILVNSSYNIGEYLEIEGVKDAKDIFDILKYSHEKFEDEIIKKIIIPNIEHVQIITKYGTMLLLDLNSNLNYQYIFGIEIIKDRIKNGLTIDGIIDFTKAENPIYTDNCNLGVGSNE